MPSLRSSFGPIGILVLALAAGRAWSEDAPKVKEDPPEKPPVLLGDKPLELKLPDSFFDPEPIWAGRHGPFVAVRGGQRNEILTVLDLRDQSKVGEFTTDAGFRPAVALSPDGSLLALSKGVGAKSQVLVYDTAKGAVSKELATQNAQDWIEFLSADKLLTSAPADKGLTLWDLKTGEGKKLSVTFDAFQKLHTVSPGGRYAALVQGKKIALFDLTAGEVAQTYDMPTEANTFPHRCHGLAFSPDGTRLSGLFEQSQKYHIVTWSLKDGKASDLPLEVRPGGFYQGPKLLWSPDGAGWLVNGDMVIDGTTGKLLWQIVEKDLKGNKRLLAIHTAIGTGDAKRPARILKSISPGKDKVAAIQKALAAGGTALDALLPKAIDADVSKAKTVEVRLGGVAWAVKPDPATANPDAAARPFALECPAGEVDVLRFPRAESGRIVVGLRPTRDAFGKPTAAGPHAIEVYNLLTGKRLSHFDLPYAGQVDGISPDGGRAVTADAEEAQRVDAWDLEGKHVVGFRPFAKEEEKNQKVTFAALPASDKLLTANDAGTVVLWALPGAKAEYRLEAKGVHGWQLSPGGKWIIGFDRDVVRVFDALTGAPSGDLAVPASAQGGEAEVVAVSVQPDAKEVAALVAGPKAFPQPTALLRWDFATGKLLGEVPLAKAGLSPRFGNQQFRVDALGEPYFLINGHDLLDAKRQEVVWRYEGVGWGGVTLAAERPDGRTWYVAPGIGPNAPGSLVATKLPEAEVEKYVKLLLDPEKSILKEGQAIDLQLAMTGTRADAVKDKAQTALKNALTARGLKVAGSDDLQLTLTVTERATGETLSFRKLFPKLGDRPLTSTTVKELVLDCSAVLRIKGKPVWQSPKQTLGMRTLGIITLPKDENDIGKFLTTQMWDQVPTWAAGTTPPKYLVQTDEGIFALPGQTRLQSTGPATLKPIVAIGK